ncbi:hypothetical protein ACFL6G_00435 [candidate division KSB1 bacterium]
MRSRILVIFTILCFITLLTSGLTIAQTKKYEVLIGTWDMEIDIMGELAYHEFVFETKDDSISGYWSDGEQNADFTKIVLDGSKLILELEVDTGGGYETIKCEAEIEGDEMKGTAESDSLGEMTFTAKKRK